MVTNWPHIKALAVPAVPRTQAVWLVSNKGRLTFPAPRLCGDQAARFKVCVPSLVD